MIFRHTMTLATPGWVNKLVRVTTYAK